MIQALTSQASSPIFEYLEHDMELTRAFHMLMVTERISVFVYAVPFVFIALTEGVVKNGLFLMYNLVAFTLNTIIDVAAKVSELAMSCFCDDDEDNEVQISHVSSTNTERFSPYTDSQAYINAQTASLLSRIRSVDQIRPAQVDEPAEAVRVIPTAYAADDLITLKFAIKDASSPERPIEVTKDGLRCHVWYNRRNDVLCIRNLLDQRTLTLKITDVGQFSSICLDGVDQDRFPADFDLCMAACLDKAFEVSSTYNTANASGTRFVDNYGRPLILIRTLKESLSRVPAYHLEQFVAQLASIQGTVPSIRVQFRERSLQNNEAIDAGGPSRDWLDALMKAVTEDSNDLRFTTGEGGLKMPATATEDQDDDPLLPTMLSDGGRKMCREIGQVMLFAHQTHRREWPEDQQRELMIGNIFEKALYEAIFSLAGAEVDAGFDQLSEATLLKMAHAIFRARNTPTEVINLLGCMLPQDQRYVLPAAELALEQVQYLLGGMSVDRQGIWREAHEWARISNGWIPIANFDPRNTAHRQQVRNGLVRLQDPMTPDRWAQAHLHAQGSDGWENIPNFDHTNPEHQLQVQNGLRKLLWAQLGESLDPIHAMAQGMVLAKRRWDVDLSQETPTQFCDKIQGTIDREAVANSLQILDRVSEQERTPPFNNQFEWLKDWVLNEASSDQVTALVRFATGGSTLPIGGRIFVEAQRNFFTPMPKGHTCFNQIDLTTTVCNLGGYSNATKGEFLAGLQYALSQTEHTAR